MISRATVILLEQAKANRERSERARRLAQAITDRDARARLSRFAEELEQTAHDLEERARTLSETIAKTESLSADIHALVEEAHQRLEAMEAGRQSTSEAASPSSLAKSRERRT